MKPHRRRTLNSRRWSRRMRELAAALYPPRDDDEPRPRTVGECAGRELGTPQNPCPWVSCKFHLALDVDPLTQSVWLRAPLLPDDGDGVPSLDLAAFGYHCAARPPVDGLYLQEIADATGLTRERIRQEETAALEKLRAVARAAQFEDPPAGAADWTYPEDCLDVA